MAESGDMVELPGGVFLMGSEDPDARREDGEGPLREVTVDAFAIAATTVTNAEFAAFAKAAGYRTEAEDFGWAYVFQGLLSKSRQRRFQDAQAVPEAPWWLAVDGACWRKPEGPGSNLSGRMHHPVVQVSWHDALAYCRWANARLPTEAEWEYAARGGLVGKRLPWGDELQPNGKHRCNVWQGSFPQHNSVADGYFGTAPAKSYRRNGYGLYNMAGNVWEWCQDDYRVGRHGTGSAGNAGSAENKVLKGGSYLCHESYCNRYRVAARYANSADTATGNIGFRCAR